jgi:alkaline phosphatase D
MNRPESAGDGTWYGGTPLWVLAEQQGMRAASFFWPGSDAAIQNTRPSQYFKYDGKIPNEARVEQVIRWFELPKENRPHFVTLYFSDTDDAGHNFGPESSETRAAVERLDKLFGILMDGLRRTGVAVNVFVVADHGMTAQKERVILGTTTDFPGMRVIPASGSIVMMYGTDEASIKGAEQFLKRSKDPRFRVYRKRNIPKHLHFRDSARIGDLVILAQAPVNLLVRQPGAADPKLSQGAHGYDPRKFPDMRGIFIAGGPNLAQHKTIGEFQNIHVYPLIARLLGLQAPAIDGNLGVLQPLWRNK